MDPSARAARAAARAGFAADSVQGTVYRHEVFTRPARAGDPLYVFIEGDGSPWNRSGTRVSASPTPRHPLALRLALQTPHPVLYLGRPCYFNAGTDPACSPVLWTSERYSATVVESMAAVVNRYSAQMAASYVVLIGYSGGGTLAALMAPRVAARTALVTIAGNLDTDAWTRSHRYSPLTGSLNPADQALPERPHAWYWIGDRDRVVPAAVAARYLDGVPVDHVWHFATFDHVCCWEQHWPELLARLDAAIEADSD